MINIILADLMVVCDKLKKNLGLFCFINKLNISEFKLCLVVKC